MADKYLLGPKAARFLHDAMNATGGDYGKLNGKAINELYGIPAPWTLRWSSSIYASGPGGGEQEEKGAFVIYLPDDSLIGAKVDVDETSDGYMRPLFGEDSEGWPDGWYVMPQNLTFDESTVLRAGVGKGTIRFSTRSTSKAPIVVACVKRDLNAGSVNIDQYVRSVMTTANQKPFDLIMEEEDGDYNLKVVNPYYNVGAITYELEADEIEDITYPCYVALRVSVSSDSEELNGMKVYETLQALNEAQKDYSYATIPIYQFDEDGIVVCDFRSGPIVVAGEV